MTLSIPNYIQTANIQDNSIRYEWDDWDDLPALETPDEELVAQLEGVSQRAVLAFACGTAEWIVYRFTRLLNDSAPMNYLEAAWAMIVNMRYRGGPGWQYFSLKGWEGPVKGPVKDALEWLEIASQQLASEYHTDPKTDTGLISALACHVMTDPTAYKIWRGQVMERFESIYPRDPEDELGDVVPREAVDPYYDFKIDQTESLINKFLASLDYRSNIFLSAPEEMLKVGDEEDDGFIGTPYVFDINTDRKSRRRQEI
ncbi:hypothetical protein KA005_03990 [bacterium]|nr:hypothetical protein [bacterium]